MTKKSIDSIVGKRRLAKKKVIFCASIYFFQVQYFLEDFYYSMYIPFIPLRVKNCQGIEVRREMERCYIETIM